jgi:hypothetical protein
MLFLLSMKILIELGFHSTTKWMWTIWAHLCIWTKVATFLLSWPCLSLSQLSILIHIWINYLHLGIVYLLGMVGIALLSACNCTSTDDKWSRSIKLIIIQIQPSTQHSSLIQVTLHVSILIGHLQVFLVTHYSFIGLQHEIHIFLFT